MTGAHRAAAALLLAAATPGCHVGVSAGNFLPAQSGAGIEVRLDLTTHAVIGELLTADESRLLVACHQRMRPLEKMRGASDHCRELVFVPYEIVKGGRFQQLDAPRLAAARAPAAKDLTEIRLLSRYPQGLTSELLARLAAAYGQTEVGEETP